MEPEKIYWIYESMMGRLVDEAMCAGVENLFRDGMPCMALYTDAIEAYWRLCDRLGVEEDDDGEIMINSLLKIGEITGMQMFRYGAEFGIKQQ